MNMIELSSNENEIVLDPFMGSGSTGVACVNTNRQFIGIEISEQYFESVQERIIEAEKRNKFDKSAIFQGMSESNEVDMFE
jgi:DNA modification methylase